MPEDPQNPSKEITVDSSSKESELDSDTPDVGIGLIILGGICLLFGIALGLVFTLK